VPDLAEGNLIYIWKEWQRIFRRIAPSVFLQPRRRAYRWQRIFRAEAEGIHFGRVQFVPGHLQGIEGIPHHDEAFFQAIQEPPAVEGRDIRALSGIDNHKFLLSIYFIIRDGVK